MPMDHSDFVTLMLLVLSGAVRIDEVRSDGGILYSHETVREIFEFEFPDGKTQYWDIDEAKEVAANESVRQVTIHTGESGLLDLLHAGHITIDFQKAQAMPEHCLTDPLYAVAVPDTAYSIVIDGWHRIARAEMAGIYELPCLLFSSEQESRFSIDIDKGNYYGPTGD